MWSGNLIWGGSSLEEPEVQLPRSLATHLERPEPLQQMLVPFPRLELRPPPPPAYYRAIVNLSLKNAQLFVNILPFLLPSSISQSPFPLLFYQANP